MANVNHSFMQRQLLRRIAKGRAGVEHHSWRAHHIDSRARECTKKGEEVRQAGAAALQSPSANSWVMRCILVAVYVVDLLLFGPVAEYFATQNFGDVVWLQILARLAVPLAILLMELYLTEQTLLAQEAAEEGRESPWRYRFWVASSTLFAVVLPAGVVATFLVSNSGFPIWVDGALLLMLGALAIVGHLAILFGRRPLLESLEGLRYSMKAAYWECVRRRAGKHGRQERQWVAQHFREYSGAIHKYNLQFPHDPVQVEPFDLITLRILRELFGEDVVRTPQKNDAPTTQPIPSSPEPGGANNEGETEYLRSILSCRQREEDSEVRL